ncbi:MAG: hypothetical protein ABFS32_14075 [Bacteroidota bacterium]
MKNLAAIFLFLAFQVNAQEYTVLQIKGEITRVSTGKLLKQGDKISDDEKISFKTNNAMAAVLSTTKGRYIIKPKQEELEKSNDLVYVLKSTVTPVRGGMSTRAAGIQNALDLKMYFSEKPYVWVGEEIRLEVSGVAFPMNENNFFFISYVYNDQVINKMLGHDNEDLILKKKTLFEVDGEPIDPTQVSNYKLYYYKVDSEESTLITQIEFVLIDTETLESLYSQLQNDGEDTFYHIADLYSDLYGKCDPLQIRYNLMK